MKDEETIIKLLELIDNTLPCTDDGPAKGYYQVFLDDENASFLKNISEGRLQNILNILEEEEVIKTHHSPILDKEAMKLARDKFINDIVSIDKRLNYEDYYDHNYYYYLISFAFKKLKNFDKYLKKIKNKNRLKIPKSVIKKGELHFDKNNGIISYKDKKCKIPLGTNQYYVALAIFRKPLGEKIQEDDLYDDYLDSAKEHKRTTYDACRALNEKVEKCLGLKKLFINKKALVYLNEEYFSN